MKTPEEIVQSLNEDDSQFSEKKSIAGIIRAVVLEAKQFFTDLFSTNTDKLSKNKFDVEVKNFPKPVDIQKINGEVSLKNAREYVIGLNEIKKTIEKTITSLEKTTRNLNKELKPKDINLKPVVEAIDAIPETKIPDYPKEMSVCNFRELKKMFDDLAKKFDIKIPETVIPPYPKKIEVSNFPKPIKEPEPEKMTGFYWNKDENGNVSEIVEKYPSGDVVSDGWNLGRVKIDDRR